MFFDRNEMHIKAFVDFIDGKLMSGHSSSSTFHDFQDAIISNYQNSGILNFKDSKWTALVSEISQILKFSDSQM